MIFDIDAVNIRITDLNHPHFGESGILTGEVVWVMGIRMAKVELMDCNHGTDGCYVTAKQVEKIVKFMK